MMIAIALIVSAIVLGIIHLLLGRIDEKAKRTKKGIELIVAILLVFINGLIEALSIQMNPPIILFDSDNMYVHFTDVQFASTIYGVSNDANTEPVWEKYKENSEIPISKVPTYFYYKSKLWFLESDRKESTIRKEDDSYIMVSEIYTAGSKGLEDVVIESETKHGWGPSRDLYSMRKPAAQITFNSIVDNDEVGDERFFVSASEYTGDANKNYWSDCTYVKEGHEYVVRIYVHNNAASNLNLTAQDVRAYIVLPNNYAESVPVECKITCSNAEPKGVWDGTVFYSDDGRPFALSYVEDSLKYYTNAGIFRLQHKEDVGIPAFQREGVLLGYDELNGSIPGCIQYAGYLTFHVKPVFQE